MEDAVNGGQIMPVIPQPVCSSFFMLLNLTGKYCPDAVRYFLSWITFVPQL